MLLALAVVLGLAVVVAVWYRPWSHANRAAHQAGPVDSTPPLAAGEPPLAAAAVLRLSSELPETVEQFNDETLAVGRLLVDTLTNRPEAYAQLAFAQLQVGQEREALKSWREALSRDGNFADAHLGIGVILEEQGENEQAIASYRKAIELNPDEEHAYRELAEVLLRVGKASEALEVARECARRFPTVCEHHFWVGQAYLELGDYERALQAHEEAIRIDPDFALSYFPLARACARLGRNDEAARYQEKFAELRKSEMEADSDRSRNYDDPMTQRYRLVKRHALAGTLHLQFGDLRLAEAHWLRAAAIGPLDTATRKALVSLYQQQNRPGAELQFLDQLIPLEPDNLEHPLRKGRLLIEMHSWPEAETLLTGLAEKHPESADAHLLLAEMYLRKGSNESAAFYAEKAVSLAASSKGFLVLAAAQESCGDRAGALEALNQAISLDPTNEQIRRTYEQLLASE